MEGNGKRSREDEDSETLRFESRPEEVEGDCRFLWGKNIPGPKVGAFGGGMQAWSRHDLAERQAQCSAGWSLAFAGGRSIGCWAGSRQTATCPTACWLCDPWQITLLSSCCFACVGGLQPRLHGVVVELDELGTWSASSLAHAWRVQPDTSVPGMPFSWSLGKTYVCSESQFLLPKRRG